MAPAKRNIPGLFGHAEQSWAPDESGGGGEQRDEGLSPRLQRELMIQENLCENLESLADDLPDNVDTQKCLIISKRIFSVVQRAHKFEEKELFPALRTAYGDSAKLPLTLERLRYEHWEDEAFAGELSECLSAFVADRGDCNIESLAWMLRGFFEGLRRHIAFEREHILPLVMHMETPQ